MIDTIVQGSLYGGVHLSQDDNRIHLSDDDIARLIQVRFCFERMTYDDLGFALTLWQGSTGVKQVFLSEVMAQVDP